MPKIPARKLAQGARRKLHLRKALLIRSTNNLWQVRNERHRRHWRHRAGTELAKPVLSVLEIAAAKEHWRIVTTELRDRQLLAAANGHYLCGYGRRDTDAFDRRLRTPRRWVGAVDRFEIRAGVAVFQPGSRITVTAVVGYSTTPDAIRHAMLMFIATWYAQRENVLVRAAVENLPMPSSVDGSSAISGGAFRPSPPRRRSLPNL
ncbi:MAG: head-tail connector protein [Rhizobiaceae bacterium]